MEVVRLNIAYDLLQTTKLTSNTANFERKYLDDLDNHQNYKILQRTNQVYFVICNSCYWCATFFGIDDLETLSASSTHVLDCHVCNSHNTELIPVSTNESFRIDYSLTRGMELEFYKSNNVFVRQQSANG
jgi:hypothetical protein